MDSGPPEGGPDWPAMMRSHHPACIAMTATSQFADNGLPEVHPAATIRKGLSRKIG